VELLAARLAKNLGDFRRKLRNPDDPGPQCIFEIVSAIGTAISPTDDDTFWRHWGGARP
jgi:hypothetical protein